MLVNQQYPSKTFRWRSFKGVISGTICIRTPHPLHAILLLKNEDIIHRLFDCFTENWEEQIRLVKIKNRFVEVGRHKFFKKNTLLYQYIIAAYIDGLFINNN